MSALFALLADRAVLAIGGEEARAWLQGLVSNDMNKVAPDRPLYAALLSPQGKYLFDFLIAEKDGWFLLDTEAGRLADLKKRLGLYKLRSKVVIEERPDWAVGAIAPGGEGALGLVGVMARAYAGGIALVDPRLAALGARVIAPKDGLAPALAAAGLASGFDYEDHRLVLGVPEGSRDMPPDKAFLLESNFEEMNGVDFDKGCYIGQETTTRTKRRGLVRKRLLPIEGESDLPVPGTAILVGDIDAGELRSARGRLGLALVRLDALEISSKDEKPLNVGGIKAATRRSSLMSS